MRDGVADRRDGRAAARFADPERRTIGSGFDELDGDLRPLAEAQYGIALPVARADAALVEPHALFQGPADGLDDAAFKLVDRAVGVDHQARIGSTPHAQYPHALAHFNFGDDGGISSHVLVPREADAAALSGARRRPPCPPAHLYAPLASLSPPP